MAGIGRLAVFCIPTIGYTAWLGSHTGGRKVARDTARDEVIDNQVRSVRVRQVIGAFEAGERKGTYWGIRTDIADYGVPDTLPCPAGADPRPGADQDAVEAP